MMWDVALWASRRREMQVTPKGKAWCYCSERDFCQPCQQSEISCLDACRGMTPCHRHSQSSQWLHFPGLVAVISCCSQMRSLLGTHWPLSLHSSFPLSVPSLSWCPTSPWATATQLWTERLSAHPIRQETDGPCPLVRTGSVSSAS